MEAAIGFCLLLVLMIIGVPIAFAFAGMTYFLTIMYDIEISNLSNALEVVWYIKFFKYVL